MRRMGGFSTRVVAAAVVAGSMLVGVPSIGAQPAWAATSKNLIKNGDAEKGTGSSGAVVPVPSWTRTAGGSFTVLGYASGSGGPDQTSPGPKKRGANFFAGGPDDASNTIVASQTVKLKPYATAIAGGGVGFSLSGYLGGYSSQDDQASLEVDFKDKHGSVISSATIGPVLAADRGSITGLILRTTAGSVPMGAKSVLVQLILVRTAGNYNDAYADNLALTLSGV